MITSIVVLSKNYLINEVRELSNSPSIRIKLINIAKVIIPIKNFILMRSIDDKIVFLKNSGSCAFCDLTKGNLNGEDLKNVDLRYAVLIEADLSNSILSGANLRNANLSGANLSGVDLSNQDLTGTILNNNKVVEILIKNPQNLNSSWKNKIQNLNITRYDFSKNGNFFSTKEGSIFEFTNNELNLVLDLSNSENTNSFNSDGVEAGLLGIASKDDLIYLSYTVKNNDGVSSLVVDEFSNNFIKVRNIIKIDGFNDIHFGGNLLFDNLGKLYLSVGDGYSADEAQKLNSLKGKILRLDLTQSKLNPEIIAYGIRNPWGVAIDSKNRMFVLQCGQYYVEAAFLLDDLYPNEPFNLGWPIYEGSKRLGKDDLLDVLTPIFETYSRPGCLTAGIYLEDFELFLFADFYGTIRLLKQNEVGEWYLYHEHKQDKFIWSFGFDKKTKKILIAPNNLEVEIIVN